MDFAIQYLRTFFSLFVEMAPYLLLGFLFAGILHIAFRGNSLAKFLGKPGPASSVKAAMLGVPLPLCSCGVIPTGLSLHKHGASKGATVSFLVSTPQTGLDSIFATSALMGWPMAIVRPIAAFVTGVVGGILTDRFDKPAPATITAIRMPQGSRMTSLALAPAKVGVSPLTLVKPVAAGAPCSGNGCCSAEQAEQIAAGSSTPGPRGIWANTKEIFRYGFEELLGGIAKWLLQGLAIAALISLVVPDDFFARYLSNYWLSVLLVLAVSVPLYVCATGSIPVAVALMMKGMSPGVAFVFLMAGPATMASTIAVVGKSLGRKTLAIYLGAIVAGAVLFGFLIDSVLPASWFLLPMGHHAHHAHEEMLPLWFQYACAVLLAVFLLNVYRDKLLPRKKNAALSEVPMKSVTLKIDTITCNNCKRHLERDVGNVAGVTRVVADVPASTLMVEGGFDDAAVRAAIVSAGYQVAETP